MPNTTRRQLRGKRRHGLFRAWVAASALVALYVGFGGPLATYLGENRTLVAAAVPALMIFMLTSGLGWLVLLVNSKRSRR